MTLFKRISAVTALALLVLAAAIGLRIVNPGPLEMVRLEVFDLYNRLEPREPQGDSPVVIVDIDEKSLSEIGQWPWPRTVIAELIAALRDSGAAVVGFDVVFAEPDRTSPSVVATTMAQAPPALLQALSNLPSNEKAMAAQMQTMPTVLGQAASNSDLPPDHQTALFSSVGARLGRAGAENTDPTQFIPRRTGLVHNLEELTASASGLGVFSVDDEIDGVVRRVPMVMEVAGVVKPTLAIEMLRVGFAAQTIATVVDPVGMDEVRLQTPQGNYAVPTDAAGRIWIYFAPPDDFNTPENSGRLYVSASDIITGQVGPDRLGGRIAIVGTSATGLLDIRATPVASRMPGVEVHANLLENILWEDFIEYPPSMILYEILAAAGIGLLLIIIVPRLGPFISLVGVVIALGGLVGTSWYLFTAQRLLFDAVYPSLTAVVLFALLVFGNYLRDAAEKRQVRDAFGQYLSPDLVEQLADDPDRLQLGGETKRMTLLFCDVRGFTTISESFKDDPHGLTLLINRLLTPLTNEILDREGTIDKYMGDCIMAFWNAPLDVEDQEFKAVSAAMAMFDALETLNAARKAEAEEAGEEFLPLAVGVGLNTGDVVVGNMGSEQRFDYSVLGDAVNLAARLEGQSKSYGVDIVIGPDTASAIRDRITTVELDLIAVKGKTEPVHIFAALPEGNAAAEALHGQMLAAYRSQDFDGAEALLDQLDGAMAGALTVTHALYRDRIAANRADPPPADWDGVFVATTK